MQWDPQDPGSIVAYTPYSPLEQLDLLAFAWENRDPFATKAMTELDYWRVCAWLEARETTEQIDKLLDEKQIASIKKDMEEQGSAAAKGTKDDDFTGAWG